MVNSDDIFEAEINKQVHLAIDEADVIIFMVDVESGITDLDDAMAAILRKGKKPVVVAVNKVDNNARIVCGCTGVLQSWTGRNLLYFVDDRQRNW